MDIAAMMESARPVLVAFGLKVLGAIVAYIVGRMLIGFGTNLLVKVLEKQRVDPTIVRYLGSILTVVLNVVLVVAILGYFGVETTSFAALVAGLGIAIGAAWGGLLSNFAAGAFILMLRPFKVGDYVMAGDVEGTVRMIGLFSTVIDTPDNVQTMVGNAKVMSGTIKNYSNNPYRRVELLAQIDHSVDARDAIGRIKAGLVNIPHVEAAPAPDVEILTFNERGPVLAVRPYTNTAHYWQVYFDTNRLIRETFGEAGYPAAVSHVRMHQAPA